MHSNKYISENHSKLLIMMTIKHSVFFSLLSVLLCFPAFSQEDRLLMNGFDHDKRSRKSAFETTMWMPNRGVKLLKDEYALKVWKEVQESDCYIPKLTDDNLESFDVFQSEHLNIFLFSTRAGLDWTICRKDSNIEELQAGKLSGGYKNQDPKNPAGNCGSGSEGTLVRFRSYEKNGPLLLELYVGGCRSGEAHHEFLFRLDKQGLEEIPGSRLVMHDYYNRSEIERGWMWTSDHYSRFGKVSWSNDAEMIWTRKLRKRSMLFVIYEMWYDEFDAPLYELTCKYNSVEWRVYCEEKLLKRANITAKIVKKFYEEYNQNDRERGKIYMETVRKAIPSNLKKMGYDMSKKEQKILDEYINRLKAVEHY